MKDERPLSPHLTWYKPQLTSTLSILHRLTGLALLLPFFLLAVWTLAVAAGGAAFDTVHGFATSWAGVAVIAVGIAAIAYHLLNGIRHLLWDAGIGLELGQAYGSGWLVILLATGLTGLGWLLVALEVFS